MRPTPVAAGFQPRRPGRVSRTANPGSSAIANRDTLSAMPLAVTDVTNSRREMLISRAFHSMRVFASLTHVGRRRTDVLFPNHRFGRYDSTSFARGKNETARVHR